jgi:hypothetical protein
MSVEQAVTTPVGKPGVRIRNNEKRSLEHAR